MPESTEYNGTPPAASSTYPLVQPGNITPPEGAENPHPYNMGVRFHNPHTFDAYYATLQGSTEAVSTELTRLFLWSDTRPISGRTYGYEGIVGWFHGSEEQVRMYYGGNGCRCSLQAKGSQSVELAKRLRIVFPDHSVSRADVRQDYHYPGAWAEIRARLLEIARDHRLRVTEIQGHGHGDTLYLGSRKSVSFVRVYQKAKEMQGPDADPDHVRVELELKPGNSMAKRKLSTMDPAECWGASDWTREVADYLDGMAPEKVKLGTVYRSPELMRKRRWLVTQCLDSLQEWAEDEGGWAELGRAMHALKAELVALKSEGAEG